MPIAVRNKAGTRFSVNKRYAIANRNNAFVADPINKVIHLLVFLWRFNHLNEKTNIAFPIHINGIMYNKKIVNGPNRIPLDNAPNAGAIIIGNSLNPFMFKADVMSNVFTRIPTTI